MRMHRTLPILNRLFVLALSVLLVPALPCHRSARVTARAASLVALSDRVGALGGSLRIQPMLCRAEIPCASS